MRLHDLSCTPLSVGNQDCVLSNTSRPRLYPLPARRACQMPTAAPPQRNNQQMPAHYKGGCIDHL